MSASDSHASASPARWLWLSVLLVVGGLYGCAPAERATTEPDAPRDTLRENFRLPVTALPDSFLRRSDTTAVVAEADTSAPDSTAPDSAAVAASDTSDTPDAEPVDDAPALVEADSLSTFQRDDENLQELRGNVFVLQDSTRLRSRYALRSLTNKTFLFTQDVSVFERGDTLYADTVLYDRRTKVGRARSNVVITDGDVVLRSSSATYYTEEKRSVFPDSVTLVDSSRVLTAASGVYYSDEKRAEFAGDVHLTDPDTDLKADSLTYLREDRISVARGNVFIERRPVEKRTADEDTTTQTYLFGRRARNEDPNQYSRVEGNALLVQIRSDSTGAPEDTFAIRARRLEATRSDTLRRLTAVDSVRVWQTDLSATADSLVYDRFLVPPSDSDDGDRSGADSTIADAQAPSDTTTDASADSLVADGLVADSSVANSPVADSSVFARQPVSDTLSTARGGAGVDSLQGRQSTAAADSSLVAGTDTLRADGAATGGERPDTTDASDAPPQEETRLFRSPNVWFEQTQVSGDSIRVRATRRSIDSVTVWSSAFAAQLDTALQKVQQLKGKALTAYFRNDSLRRIVSEPNAQTIRYLGDGNGATKISSDRIVIRLRDGKLHRFSALAGVQQTVYEEENIPTPFQLEGYRWTPDTRPTRALLDDPRVRRRLQIDVTPALAQTTPADDPEPTPEPTPDSTPESDPLRPDAEPSERDNNPNSPDGNDDR